MHKELEAKYGPRITLYRGMGWQSITPAAKSLWQLEKGDACTLQSWRKRIVFEWTLSKNEADIFSDQHVNSYSMMLQAQIPIKQILYAYETFKSRSFTYSEPFDFEDDFPTERGFLVWHNKPIKATIINKHRYKD